MIQEAHVEEVVTQDINEPIYIHRQKSKGKVECAYKHMHDYIELLYCIEGNYLVVLNETPHKFSKGDLVVINSREIHSIFSQHEGCGEYICARFLLDLLYTSTASAFDIKYVLPFMFSNSKHQRVFSRAEIENTLIPALMYELCNEFHARKYGYELAIKTDISRIFLWILRYWDSLNVDLSVSENSNDDMTERMRCALDYISKNYADDIKASEVAQICHLSYSYFSRIFKHYMKKSFSEYLCYVRITNAEKLLASTRMQITDVALSCGFSCSSYFIKQFREIKGVSPKKYRDEYMR